MKAKMKFDTGAIKEFFVEHGEKFVVGIAAIVLGMFAVSIFRAETLPENHAKIIRENCQRELASVEQTPAPTGVVTLNPIGTKASVAPVSTTPLEIAPIVVPDTNPLPKRGEPRVFPAIEIQATPLRGAVAIPVNGAVNNNVFQQPAPQQQNPPKKGGADVAPPKAGPAVRGNRPPIGGNPNNAGPVAGVPGRGPNNVIPGGGAGAGGPVMLAQGQPGAASSGAAEARDFVIITALIPEELQRKEFAAKFGNAQNMEGGGNAADPAAVRNRMAQNGDAPDYIWWKLERTDSADGSTKLIDCGDVAQIIGDMRPESIGRQLVMESLKPTNGFKALIDDVKKWNGVGADVVDVQYKGPDWLTWPLPPVILHDWGREATHPKLPLASEETVAGPNNNDKPDDKKPDDGFGAADTPAGRTGVPGGVPGGNGPVAGPVRRPMSPDVMAGPGGMPGAKPLPPYRLFRFVDFNVEPGHAYSYRLKLVLRNPNYGKNPQVLEKPDLAKAPYRETEWSEKSKPVSLPGYSRVLAAGLAKSRGEVKAKANVMVWDKKDAIDVMSTVELELGSVANVLQTEFKDLVDPVKRQSNPPLKTDLVSDQALVDLRGTAQGEKTPVDGISEPAELLMVQLDDKGKPTKMTIVNQAEDKPVSDEWEKYHKPPSESATGAGNGPFGQPQPQATPPGPGGGLFGPTSPKGAEKPPKKPAAAK